MADIDVIDSPEFQWLWTWTKGESPNYPQSGPPADAGGSFNSGYLFLDSSPTSQVSNTVALWVLDPSAVALWVAVCGLCIHY